jgi:hypothetical protein
MNYPDHNTINGFRSDRLKGVLREVFNQVVLLLVEAGHITLKEAFLDGTKIEANANRYSFVWGRTIQYNKDKIKSQLQELWDYAEDIAKEELENNEPVDFEEIDSEKVKETIEKIDHALKDKEIDKKIKQKIKYAKKTWPKNLNSYKELEDQMGGRNSLSKTDPDATFMRMKEDRMQNGELKPAYNWQISTENQFILCYTLHQTTTDTTTLINHLETFKNSLGKLPDNMVADAGYGSDENYEYMQSNDIEAYVKYNYFHKEQDTKWKEDPSKVENLHYNEEKDVYYCPMGQPMTMIEENERVSSNGFKQLTNIYQAVNCKGCPIRGRCFKGLGNRRIEVNQKLRRHKIKAKERLNSEQGKIYRSRRPVDVEPVFGMVKYNRNYKRFLLRGLENVEIEAGLISLAHNIKKIAS